MNFSPNPCPKCGKCVVELVEQRFNMATFRCAVCGWEERGTVSFVIPDMKDHQVQVFIAWNRGRPSKKEILVARRLIRQLNSAPVAELVSKMKTSAKWPLGVYWKNVADELKKAASAAGLHIEYEPVDGP